MFTNKPFVLLRDGDNIALAEENLEILRSESLRGRTAYNKLITSHIEEIRTLTVWALDNFDKLKQCFPKTKSGNYSKNSNLLVKEFCEIKAPSGQTLSSRGFEGTNLRMIISIENGKLCLKVGEYPNLSGKILTYRNDYPLLEQCEICNTANASTFCSICGKSVCKQHISNCQECNTNVCATCDSKKEGLLFSAHHWYYHR